MPLLFHTVCELLEQCHELSLTRKRNTQAVVAWFARYRTRIDAHDTNLAALLSTLLPEKRTDRVYCIQASRLEKIIARALFLGLSRISELTSYKQPGLGSDLADCVERILTTTPNPKPCDAHGVTVEEIDDVLHGLASRTKWSSPSIRASQSTLTPRDRSDLEEIYRRLDAKEAKWFTRLVLKDYRPLIIDSQLVYRLCDSTLPYILQIQDDFTAAISCIHATSSRLLPNSARTLSPGDRVLRAVKPKLGVKVGRQQWLKGRSIKHCLDIGHGRMSVEQKMDGEYCQIHIDASKGKRGVQIFSKSGKDSTEDREALLDAICNSLKIGQHDCQIRKQCILEGELVVYSDAKRKILPFYNIRKHVTRRGRLLNTEQDSPPNAYEHLMIVYYDILLLDDESLLDVRHSERFKLLEKVVTCSEGQAELVPRQVIDFGHAMGASNLRGAFAKTIVEKGEGLVLKPDEPYFSFGRQSRPWFGCVTKLKKEYIGNFGDVGDFAVVGAGFDPVKAKSYKIPDLQWTHFHVACLDNREEVKRWDAMPEFIILNVVELNETLLKTFTAYASLSCPVPSSKNASIKLKLAPGIQQRTPLTTVFTSPMVFDLRCFSFDKEGNTGFWSLRFPMVTKIHFDRDYSDTVSFEEVQRLARDAIGTPDLEDSQENLEWIARLEGADPRGRAVDEASQLTMTTMPTPSPRRSSQGTAATRSPSSPAAVRAFARRCGSSQPTGGLLKSRPREFAIPQVPLITPPTSSAPAPPTSQPAPGRSSRKRISPASAISSPRHKRRRSREAQSPLSSSPARRTTKSQNRKPLEEVDTNSQHSMTPNTSFASDTQKARSRNMAEPSSPVGSFTAAEARLDSSQTEVFSSQIPQPTAITVPDEDSPRNVHNQEECCSYAGFECQLSRFIAFISRDLHQKPPKKLTELFDGHRIQPTIMDSTAFVEEEKVKALSDRVWVPGPEKMLLVDSIDMPSEARSFLEELEGLRSSLPEGRRDWIRIYDWRVLDHLRIMEDKTVAKKYYDGFSDPWRRWYYGLV